MLEPQMFTLCYYAAIILLLNVYYAAINLSCYYAAVMLLLCCHYANIMLLLILKVYYAAILITQSQYCMCIIVRVCFPPKTKHINIKQNSQ